jgi:hypothetical protein
VNLSYGCARILSAAELLTERERKFSLARGAQRCADTSVPRPSSTAAGEEDEARGVGRGRGGRPIKVTGPKVGKCAILRDTGENGHFAPLAPFPCRPASPASPTQPPSPRQRRALAHPTLIKRYINISGRSLPTLQGAPRIVGTHARTHARTERTERTHGTHARRPGTRTSWQGARVCVGRIRVVQLTCKAVCRHNNERLRYGKYVGAKVYLAGAELLHAIRKDDRVGGDLVLLPLDHFSPRVLYIQLPREDGGEHGNGAADPDR